MTENRENVNNAAAVDTAVNNETLADIAAEIGRAVEYMGDDLPYTVSVGTMRKLASRIKAAAKREKAAIEAGALAVGGIVEAELHKPGNAAAMREALAETQSVIEKCLGILNRIPDNCGYWGLVDEAADELCYLREGPLKAALSAPARNCDRFCTIEQAKAAYCSEVRNVMIWDGYESDRFEKWLIAPVKERKGDCDGSK